MSQHEDIYETAQEAANNLHGDTSVPLAETLESLRDLRGHIDNLIEATEADITREESR